MAKLQRIIEIVGNESVELDSDWEDGDGDERIEVPVVYFKIPTEGEPELPSPPVMSPVAKREPDTKGAAEALRIATEKALGTSSKPGVKYFVIPGDKS